MTDMLPDAIRAQVQAMPEFRMGGHRIGVRLISGSNVDDVLISGGRVTRVLGRDHPTFNAGEVIEVEDQSELALPSGL